MGIDIVGEFIKEFNKEIVGEGDVLFTLLHVFASKYIINKNPTSFHTLINSNSGAGKDFILSKFIQLFDDSTESYTRISARALDYLHTDKLSIENGFTWDNKFLCLHDIEENVLNSSTLKLFLTEGTKTAIVQDGYVRTREVLGKPVVIMTSAYSDPEREQLRRMNLINLDESEKQTKRILLFEKDDEINYEYLRKLLDDLSEQIVKIPYKQKLAELICHEDIFMRSFFPKIIDFIKASAVINQKDRDKELGILLANEEDYLNAKAIITSMSYGISFKPMSLYKKEMVEKIKKEFGEDQFTIKEVENLVGCSYENARKHIKKLQQDNILKGVTVRDDFTNKPYIKFQLKSNKKISLPELSEFLGGWYNRHTTDIQPSKVVWLFKNLKVTESLSRCTTNTTRYV